jgi:hypothetical protein
VSDATNNIADDEPIRLSRRRKTKVIEIENDDGSVTKYVLKELNGTLRDAWLNRMSRSVKSDGVKGTVKDYTGLYAALISACLYTTDLGASVPVGEKTIQEWSSSCQEELFEICQKMNGLDKKSEEDEKKDSAEKS